MTRKELYLKNEKTKFSNNHKKNKRTGFLYTEEEVLYDEHTRMMKYIDTTKINKENVPITKKEIREHIKKELKKDPSFDFIVENARDQAYEQLIYDIENSKEYNASLNDRKIKVKIQKTGKYKKGIRLKPNGKYYFIQTKGYSRKSGVYVNPSRKYFSSVNGRPIHKEKIEAYLDFVPTQIIPLKKDKTNLLIKKKHPLQRFKEMKARKERLSKLRGK